MRGAVPAALALGLLAGGCGTKTVTVEHTITRVRTVTAPATTTAEPSPSACAATALGGTFAVVPGSAGAGQITYRLRLTNRAASPCFVSGLPAVRLVDAQGTELPAHVSAAQPGLSTAARVVLDPGELAVADARFSPDVPGEGETQTGACEPTAATLRVVAAGGGTLDAPIKPPTPVCEHGSLRFSVFTPAR
jgi:hypothetical protein